MLHSGPSPTRNPRRRAGRAGGLLAGLLVLGSGLLPAPAGTAPEAARTRPGNAPRPAPAAAPSFERDVRPILKAHCFDCHGEGDSLRGGLDLRLRRFMVRGGDSGPALVPGQPAASGVYERVRSGDMPRRERKPSEAEIEVLRRWVEAGAVTARPEPEDLPPGMSITAEERAHWAFQPLQRPPLPRRSGGRRIRNAVDAFIAAGQRPLGVRFAEDAPPATLIRRLYLDLWGIPPSPEDVEAFVADRRPDAYERWVDRLLDAPEYGERWGRHWLDVAGYADSDGATPDDTPRLHAYRYRDYVIRAFQEDRPFDRFLAEQLAGDELALLRHDSLEAALRDPEAREWIAATGFLRMAADGTGVGGADPEAARNQVVADTLKIVSTSLLGLSVGCAQCHDHRYDPIPQVDYYRLRAVLEPAYDTPRWRPPARRKLSLYTTADREAAQRIEAEAAALAKRRDERQTEAIEAALRKHLERFEEPLKTRLWEAFRTPAAQRTEEQKQLLKDHPSANINPGVLYQYDPKAAEELKAMDTRITEVRQRKPAEEFIDALWEEPGPVPVTFRFHRGDPRQPREKVGPGTLSILAGGGAAPDLEPVAGLPAGTGRRLALARWITSPANPLTARVLVNRVWMHHFGRGLVETPADFGLQGGQPSHPELLDWLASVFSAPASADPAQPGLGWSLKGLHRLLVSSTTYRQSSTAGRTSRQRDPENRLYTRHTLRRLDAEAVRDATLAVSGVLSPRRFGPPVPVREDAVGQVVVGIDRKVGDNKMPVEVPIGEEEFRRAVYVEVRRSKPLAFLNAFDAPVMEVNCERRTVSTVAPQALMLMNSAFALQQSRLFAERLAREVPLPEGDPAQAGPRLDRAWRLAFGRPPTGTERDDAVAFLASQRERFAARPPGEAGTPEALAWRCLCQALLSSNEFLYVD